MTRLAEQLAELNEAQIRRCVAMRQNEQWITSCACVAWAPDRELGALATATAIRAAESLDALLRAIATKEGN